MFLKQPAATERAVLHLAFGYKEKPRLPLSRIARKSSFCFDEFLFFLPPHEC